MWTQGRSNRIIAERQQTKEHIMHMQRLRAVKPVIDIKKPPKPNHLVTNYKKELQKMERMSEIQYQNRVLLKKMLQIDLKPADGTAVSGLKRVNSAAGPMMRPQSAKSRKSNAPSQTPQNQYGLNSYNSLNRANRIKGLARIIDENKVLLDKLQKTKSSYSNISWKNDYSQKMRYQNMIRKNGDRYCRNPYFLHSVCSTAVGPAYTDMGSIQAKGSYYAMDHRTISEYGAGTSGLGTRRKSKRYLRGKASEMQLPEFDTGMGDQYQNQKKKKIRPFSAPRHQGQGVRQKANLRQKPQFLKNENMQSLQHMPQHQQYQTDLQMQGEGHYVQQEDQYAEEGQYTQEQLQMLQAQQQQMQMQQMQYQLPQDPDMDNGMGEEMEEGEDDMGEMEMDGQSPGQQIVDINTQQM